MPIRADRIAADIETIGRFTPTPGAGSDRPTFSPAWRQARDFFCAEAERAGCHWRVDAAGNVHARPRGVDWSQRVWLSGSHLDSVPGGGDFDGVVGVVAALEVLRAAHDDGRHDLPLEAIVFAEEEGTTFGLGMLGSRGWAGTLDAAALAALRTREGKTYWEAGADHGAAAERLAAERLRPADYAGLVEVHIEQGPAMWKHDRRVALVTAIAGRRQYAVSLRGVANHAGSTGMNDRHDALAGAAEVIAAVECLPDLLGDHAVATVGRIAVEPNAVNVIPARAEFTIDLRAPDDHALELGDERLRALVAAAALRRGLEYEVTRTESLPAVRLDERVADRVRAAAGGLGLSPLPEAVSGALHDAAILAPLVPTVMLFVASRDGISHNPAEFSRIDDIAAATRLLAAVVANVPACHLFVTLAELNACGLPRFLAVCGPLYEHSPWVAERAFACRPFASREALHAALVAAVAAATPDEQLTLIRAHPDLVGRLARAGRLTAASTHEQAAAGLDALSADEVAAFERFNRAYHDRFGFPFVICARENRKEAILAAFPVRLGHTVDEERETALAEIGKIGRLRLLDAVTEA